MSDEYRSVLILCDEITRKLVDLNRFDLGSLIMYVRCVSDLEELQWVRNHLLVALSNTASDCVREIEKLRIVACPLLPEMRVSPEGTSVRVWTKRPNARSHVLPNDIHEYGAEDDI
jgi:hypothetical protein